MTRRKVTLKNGETRWKERVWVVEDGKRVKRELSFPRIGELEEEKDRLRAQRRRRKYGIPEPQGEITYDDLAGRVLDGYPHSATSLATLTYSLKHSRAAFGTVRVRELDPEAIRVWLAKLNRAPMTKRAALKAMRQVLGFGVRWRYLERNPAAEVELPQRRGDSKHPFESWQEVYALADAIGAVHPPYGSLVIFACATGMRPQEWRALEWREVDIHARTARVARAVQGGKIESAAKTDGSLRTVLLQQRALDALDALPIPINRGLVFPDRRGGDLLNLDYFRRNEWADALEAAGLAERGPGQMRHTFATLALAAGVPMESVAQQLGHANIRTTLEHYTRFVAVVDERNLALLDAFEADADRDGRKTDGIAEGDEAR